MEEWNRKVAQGKTYIAELEKALQSVGLKHELGYGTYSVGPDFHLITRDVRKELRVFGRQIFSIPWVEDVAKILSEPTVAREYFIEPLKPGVTTLLTSIPYTKLHPTLYCEGLIIQLEKPEYESQISEVAKIMQDKLNESVKVLRPEEEFYPMTERSQYSHI